MTLEATKYFQDLIVEFPLMHSEIYFDEGEHMNMERFATYTIIQIKKQDFNELKKCFAFQEDKIAALSADLENAMAVSYCEALLLGEVSKTMIHVTKYMGPKLFRMYCDYEIYYNNLSSRH